MEYKIFKQIKRYLVLSDKFSKTETDVFGKDDANHGYVGNLSLRVGGLTNNNVHIDGREIYVDKDGTVKAKDKEPVTRSEKIKVKAEMDSKVADEFDELLLLRNKLHSYFASLEKLTE